MLAELAPGWRRRLACSSQKSGVQKKDVLNCGNSQPDMGRTPAGKTVYLYGVCTEAGMGRWAIVQFLVSAGGDFSVGSTCWASCWVWVWIRWHEKQDRKNANTDDAVAPGSSLPATARAPAWYGVAVAIVQRTETYVVCRACYRVGTHSDIGWPFSN